MNLNNLPPAQPAGLAPAFLPAGVPVAVQPAQPALPAQVPPVVVPPQQQQQPVAAPQQQPRQRQRPRNQMGAPLPFGRGRGRGRGQPHRQFPPQQRNRRGAPHYQPVPAQQQPPAQAPQAPAQPAPVQAPPPADFNVKYILGEKQKRHLENYVVPGKTVKPGNLCHTHPISAFEREHSEIIAYREAQSYVKDQRIIVDIGGNPVRNYKARRKNIWNCCPILDETDAARHKSYEKHEKYDEIAAEMCEHLAEECDCVEPAAYMSIHSIYYLHPDVVLDLLDKCDEHVMIVACHKFEGPQGHMCAGEMQWRRQVVGGQTKIIAKVVGNNHVYTNDPSDWVHKGYYQSGHRALVSHLLATVGDTLVYQVSPSPVLPVVDDLEPFEEFRRSVDDLDFYGQIDYAFVSDKATQHPHWATMELPTMSIWSFGTHFCFAYDRRKQVIVPKELLSKLRVYMTMKHHSGATLATLSEVCKRNLRETRMPMNEQAECIRPLILLAFAMDAEDTLNDLDALAQRHGDVFERLNERLTSPTMRKYNIAPWVMVIAAACVAAWAAKQYKDSQVVPATSQITLLILQWMRDAWKRRPTWWSFWRFLRSLWKHTPPASAYTTMLYRNRKVPAHEPSSIVPFEECVQTHKPIYYITYCAEERPLVPMRKDAKISYEPEVCHPTFGSVQVGPSFANARPIVPRNCQHNEIVGIVNRTLFERTGGAYAWLYVTRMTRQYFNSFYPRHEEGKPNKVTFGQWIARFPPGRRRNLELAAVRVRERGLNHRELHKSASFVKRENLVKAIDGDEPETDPRLIQGKADEYLVSTGPWGYNFSKRLAWHWGELNGHFGVITYAAGLNAQAVGRWFDYALNTVIDPIQVNDDAARWDGSLSEHAILAELQILSMHGLRGNKLFLFATQIVSAGYTPNGVKYAGAGGRQSGVINTSSGNSILNAALHTIPVIDVLGRYPRTEECMLIVMGDDMYMMVTRSIYLAVATRMRQFLADAGIRFKLTFFENPNEAQFCSGRWWPTKHGHVIGPKPGRALAKAYFCRHELSNRDQKRWLLGVAIGWLHDASHVPIMRVINPQIVAKLALKHNPLFIDKLQRFRSEQREAADEDALAVMCEDVYPEGYDAIRQVEALVENLPSLCCTIHSALLQSIVDIDVGDPTFNSVVATSLPLPILRGLYWIAKRASRIHPTIFATVIAAPIIEEALKRHRVGWWLVVTPEIISMLVTRNPAAITPIIMHILTPRLPYLKAWLVHLVYNWTVMTWKAMLMLGFNESLAYMLGQPRFSLRWFVGYWWRSLTLCDYGAKLADAVGKGIRNMHRGPFW